jgi:hypothetical protein
MATFGRKLNENQVKQFGRKVVNASVYYGRKAGDIAERTGPMISVIGAGTGNPALMAAGAGIGMAGKATSNLLKKD